MDKTSVTIKDLIESDQADYIRVRIADAVWALRHDRFPVHGVPSGYRSSMPEPVRSYWEAYEQAAPKVTRVRPNAKDISNMDDVLPWFFMVDEQKRAVLFCRHTPLSWRTVGRILNISHEYARRLEADAVDEIRLALKRGTVNRNLLTKQSQMAVFPL